MSKSELAAIPTSIEVFVKHLHVPQYRSYVLDRHFKIVGWIVHRNMIEGDL